MRILLTGAGGQLGREVSRQLVGSGCSVRAASRSELDITDPRQVNNVFAFGDFDLVINTAAYTAVDRAEVEEEMAFRVNAEAPGYLARTCAENGAALIHVSTDYVFDGKADRPYSEADPPHPANVYGRSKEAGERAVRGALERHVILRTAWVYGAHGPNFVKTILRLAMEKDELSVVSDQRGNPTAAMDLARCITQLTQQILSPHANEISWGTYHCVNRDAASWCDFAQAILDHAEPALGRRVNVRPITSADYPTPAARPMNSQLDCTRLREAFGLVMPSWRRTLPQVIDEILLKNTWKTAKVAP